MKQLDVSFRLCVVITLIAFSLASCGGGGGGGDDSNGGSNGGNNSGATYGVSLTGIELEDTRNGRLFSASSLPVDGAIITRE